MGDGARGCGRRLGRTREHLRNALPVVVPSSCPRACHRHARSSSPRGSECRFDTGGLRATRIDSNQVMHIDHEEASGMFIAPATGPWAGGGESTCCPKLSRRRAR
jgi:hypothetical protein